MKESPEHESPTISFHTSASASSSSFLVSLSLPFVVLNLGQHVPLWGCWTHGPTAAQVDWRLVEPSLVLDALAPEN